VITWLRAHPRVVLVITAAVLAFTTWLDYVTGYELGFFIFYFVPVSLAAWLIGRDAGVAVALASGACWFLSDRMANHPYSRSYFIYWETAMRLVSYLTTALTLARIRADTVERERLQARLEAALEEVRQLRQSPPSSAA
jgi:K+-sensing histidine kinase KdpD